GRPRSDAFPDRLPSLPRPPPRRGRHGTPGLVLVRIVYVAAGHRDSERSERVLDAHRVTVGGEDLRQALVHLRRLVRAAADEHDSLLAQACLYRRPVDETGLDLLLHPDLRQAGHRVIRADTLLRNTE